MLKYLINENNVITTNSEKDFIVTNNEFKLYIDKTLVCTVGYNIEEPDEFFDEKYISIYNVKTIEKFRCKGFAKYILNKIFIHAKNKFNVITLIVYKNNKAALKLYYNLGFEKYMEYEDLYSLIKRL